MKMFFSSVLSFMICTWGFVMNLRMKKRVVNLDQFVMPATERGQNADSYIRELRDNDRI